LAETIHCLVSETQISESRVPESGQENVIPYPKLQLK